MLPALQQIRIGCVPPVANARPHAARCSAQSSGAHPSAADADTVRRTAQGMPITMVTAYDYPSAVHVDKAGIDILLVGDSVGMVELGYDTTLHAA